MFNKILAAVVVVVVVVMAAGFGYLFSTQQRAVKQDHTAEIESLKAELTAAQKNLAQIDSDAKRDKTDRDGQLTVLGNQVKNLDDRIKALDTRMLAVDSRLIQIQSGLSNSAMAPISPPAAAPAAAANNSGTEESEVLVPSGNYTDGVGLLESHGYDTCLHFEGCIDGSDVISIHNGMLTHQHLKFSQIGTFSTCPAGSKFPGGGFKIDGVAVRANQPIKVNMSSIGSIKVISARGKVEQSGPSNVLFDDNGFVGAAVYKVDICPG